MYANDVPINLAENLVLLKRKHMIMPIDGFSMILKYGQYHYLRFEITVMFLGLGPQFYLEVWDCNQIF